MSQGVDELFNLARTAYLRLVPHLQPAAQIALAVVLSAASLGPEEIFLGAAVGASLSIPATRQWVRTAIVAFTTALFFIQEQPDLVSLIHGLLNMMRRYLSGEPGLQY